MEAGSPEFAEDRTQINSLNNKLVMDQHFVALMRDTNQTREHMAELSHRSLRSLDNLAELQVKVNEKFFQAVDDRARIRDQWNYNTAYDLANPVTTGAGDTLRSASYTPNRAVDTASAGVGVSAEAVAAAVAKQVDATITPVLATLQQVVQALATATTSIADVVNQAQPKTAPAA